MDETQSNGQDAGAPSAPVPPNAPTPSPVPPTPPTPPVSPSAPDDVTGVDSNKLMAAISYLGILVIIPLIVSRQDKFVMFHARQGLVLLIGYVVASILAAWVAVLGNLLWLVCIIVSIIGFIQAMQGKWWKVPGVGDLAAKFKI